MVVRKILRGSNSDVDAMPIPSGPTSSRPSPGYVSIRFNTTTGFFEGYDGTVWASLAGSSAGGWTSSGGILKPTTLTDLVSVGDQGAVTLGGSLVRGQLNVLDDGGAKLIIGSTSGGNSIQFISAGAGTLAVPSAAANFHVIGDVLFDAYATTGYKNGAKIEIDVRGGTWTDSSIGARMVMSVAKSGTATPTQRLMMDEQENFFIGDGTVALATSATNGFLYVRSMAGAPTGDPVTEPTNQRAIVVDHTNKRLYIHDAGATWTQIGGSSGGWQVDTTPTPDNIRPSDNTHTVSVGAAASASIHASLTRSSFSIFDANPTKLFGGRGAAAGGVHIYSVSATGDVVTVGAPTSAGSTLGAFVVNAYDGTAFQEGFKIIALTGGAWTSSTNLPMRVTLQAGIANGVSVQRMNMDEFENVFIGRDVALATTVTDGFLYIRSTAGTPTGDPTTEPTNQRALIVDHTKKNLMLHDAGTAWFDVGSVYDKLAKQVAGSGLVTEGQLLFDTAVTSNGITIFTSKSASTATQRTIGHFYASAVPTTLDTTAWAAGDKLEITAYLILTNFAQLDTGALVGFSIANSDSPTLDTTSIATHRITIGADNAGLVRIITSNAAGSTTNTSSGFTATTAVMFKVKMVFTQGTNVVVTINALSPTTVTTTLPTHITSHMIHRGASTTAGSVVIHAGIPAGSFKFTKA